ncbi:MAG TPA: AAA family ATPase [Candidatus Limnocylindria bacterium]|nr:AAA family ATPase [Candidatus Limnocylindria bacterium]
MREARCPILVGRDQEFAVLTDHLRDARRGKGGLVFLVGEAGIGKSRLAREAVVEAERHTMRMVRGRAVETAPAVPFRPLAQAFSTLPGLSDLLARPELVAYRSALRHLLAGSSADGTPRRARSPMAVLEGISRLLGALAADDGLVVVLEDLHWADADTMSAVEYLADSLSSRPILCLCTARSDEASSVTALVARLTAARLATQVELRRLPDHDVGAMVRACVAGSTIGDDTVQVVGRRAEGVPFFVEELLTAALSAASDGAATDLVASTVPPSYADIVHRQVEGLGGRGRSVIDAAAILGRTFDWPLLGPITGLDDEEVLAELRRATVAHLVTAENGAGRGAFAFRHALTRDAVLADLLPPEREQLCISAANALESARPGLPAELCELAADLRGRGGDREGAFRLAMESARRAFVRGALATAETTLDRAIVLAGDDPWLQMGAGMFLADVLSSTGRVDRLVALGATLVPAVSGRLSLGTPDRVAAIHLRLARGLLEGAEVDIARAHLADAVPLAQAAGDASILLACDALTAELALEAGDLATAERMATTLIDRGFPGDAAEVRCAVLRVLGVARRRTGELTAATAALEEARALAETAGLAVWRARLLLDLAAVDEMSGADVRRASLARTLAADSGAVALEARSELQLGRILLARGEVAPAEEAIDRAIAIRRQFRLPTDREALVARAVLLARSGRRRDLADAIRNARASAPARDPLDAILAGEARAVAYLLAEDATKALGALEQAPAAGSDELVPWAFPGLRVLVLALVETVPIDPGTAVPPRQAAYRATNGLVHLARAVWHGRAGRVAEAEAAFGAAERALEPFPFYRALGIRLVAPAAIEDRWGMPGAWLHDALEFFDAAGHDRVVAAIRGLLRRAGEKVPRRGRGDSQVPPDLRVAGITSREMDVLRLAADGLTYRSIAARLYLSPRTVQTHVISILGKLGLESKSELAAHAGRLPAPLDGLPARDAPTHVTPPGSDVGGLPA